MARALAAVAVLMAGALAIVALRVQAVRAGYRFEGLDNAERALEEEGRDLESRIERTVTPARARDMNETLELGLAPAGLADPP